MNQEDSESAHPRYTITDYSKSPVPPGRYRFLDLFAGIGGFRFGFEPQGGSCVWSCEIDPYARRTYSRNHRVPETGIHPDVRTADVITDVPDHDVLIAGFPCQPFSAAGVSKNNSLRRPNGFLDKSRGTLFFEILRILAHHRPKSFLLENVPHLLRHDQGRTYAVIRSLLEDELGYHVSHQVIDARPFVPQRRRRVFITGHAEKDRPQLDRLELPSEDCGPNLRDILHPQDGSEPPEPPFTQGDKATVDRKYTLGAATWQALINHRERHRNSDHGFGFTIADPHGPTRTLTARYGKDGQEILVSQAGPIPRRLTPRECARLMGMQNLIIPVSDSQAYRQLGNAVVPPLVEAIAKHMMA